MNKIIKGITYRKAEKADLPKILELYKELQPQDPPINPKAAASVWGKSENSGITYFVAEKEGEIAASLYIAIIPNITRQCSPIGFIENVITAARFRRMGIGGELLKTAVEYAKSRGCYKVMLQSGNKRTEAHSFYESVGFDGSSKRAFELRF